MFFILCSTKVQHEKHYPLITTIRLSQLIIFVMALNTSDKYCNISCRQKMLSSRTLFAVKVGGMQTSHEILRISVYFHFGSESSDIFSACL